MRNCKFLNTLKIVCYQRLLLAYQRLLVGTYFAQNQNYRFLLHKTPIFSVIFAQNTNNIIKQFNPRMANGILNFFFVFLSFLSFWFSLKKGSEF
jgi:uncharacterized membrane protein